MIRVFTVGVFDLFHVGHLRCLQKAATLGDFLLVGVTTDELSATYKRVPVIPLDQRLEIVSHISCVDQVMVDPGQYPIEFYREHGIDIHCQGSEIPGYDYYRVARELRILRIFGRDPTTDTSRIIGKVLSESSALSDNRTEIV
jgi:cytidyltransferase-like protein